MKNTIDTMNTTVTPTATDLEKRIREAQLAAGDGELWDYGYPAVAQRLIDSGQGWHLEGSCGRTLMHFLSTGECFLPTTSSRDPYGNRIPARGNVQAGSKGSLELAAEFWGV